MYDYVKQHKWAKLKVGLVITIALSIIFFAVMFAGNIEKMFDERVMIYALVDDVKGLREGAPVWFSGVEIGSVKSISVTLQRKVEVGMIIASDSLKYLKKDSLANIMTLGLLGDKYVEVTPGSVEAEGLSAGDFISGDTQIEIQDVVQTSQASIAQISNFVGMLEEILVKVDKGQGTISKFIQDPAVYNNLKEAIEELTLLIRKIEGGKGTISRLINEDSLYTDLSASAGDIRLFAKSLQESEGTLGKVVRDPELYERFLKASKSLDAFAQKLSSSKGTVHKLIADESLYENINSASEKLDRILGRIDRGEGLAGSLVKDEGLSEELRSTLKELNALIRDIKDNPNDYLQFSIF